MQVVVVGAGAWGLPAAAELARRGHEVELVDAHGVGNPQASSGGATRIWRLSHPDAHGVRLAVRSVEAWRRLEERSGAELLLTRGLLWRGPDADDVARALVGEGVDATSVDPADVSNFFPTLEPNGAPAVWQADAGPVLAAEALRAAEGVLLSHGGRLTTGRWVDRIDVRSTGVRAVLRAEDGGEDLLDADVAVLAPGPWAQPLLAGLGVDVRLTPVLEQVGYVQGLAPWESWPCLIDTDGQGLGVYAMPTPGLGYKLGNDVPLRVLTEGDVDRSPDPEFTADLERWVGTHLPGLVPTVVESQVCSWTNSEDGWFVVDRVNDGRVVFACGDSGQGFKFSAFMGETLADLAEGRAPDADVSALTAARFTRGAAGQEDERRTPSRS